MLIQLAQAVNSRIYDGISTSELDELTAEICISKSTVKYDYKVSWSYYY